MFDSKYLFAVALLSPAWPSPWPSHQHCHHHGRRHGPRYRLLRRGDPGSNLDKLAANGLRFTQFYNSGRCCPTRASLLTGLHPHQAGIGHMTNTPAKPKSHDRGVPGFRGFLNRKCVTIAEVLKPRGYHTLMSGKWHVGYHGKQKWPLQRGFDRYYGIIAGASNFFRPEGRRGLTLGNEPVKPEGITTPRTRSPTTPFSSSRKPTIGMTGRFSSTSPIPRLTGRCMPASETSTSTVADTWKAAGTRSVVIVTSGCSTWA